MVILAQGKKGIVQPKKKKKGRKSAVSFKLQMCCGGELNCVTEAKLYLCHNMQWPIPYVLRLVEVSRPLQRVKIVNCPTRVRNQNMYFCGVGFTPC